MRKTATLAAALSLVGAMTGISGVAHAETELSPQATSRFSCDEVAANLWYMCQNSQMTIPAASYLRMSVRGSEGHPVRFQAYRVSNNTLIGSPSGCLRLGDPSQVIVRPRSVAERVYVRARLCDSGRLTVHATANY